MTKSYNLSRWFATLFLLLLSAFNCSAVDWLCFTAEKAGSTIWFENEGDNNPNIQYSFDGESWSDWNEKTTITLENTGDKVYVRGDNPKGFSFNAKKYTHFGMKGNISSSGSVMSLIDPNESSTEIPNSGCFFKLFSDCKSLTQAPELPATILKDSCYYLLFEKCENLETAPELPAMTMTKYCYSSMFSGCSNLTKAPKLPSLTLAQNCYSAMFTDCNNLEAAPELPATELEPYCYSTMFTACEKLKKAPDLPAKKLVDFCYFFMFERCSGLESAKISATELGPKSCIAMFMSCSNMNYIKIDVMTLDNDMSATESWVMGVTGEGIIEFPCGSKYNKYGDSGAPNNFTIKASPIVIFQNPDKEELWRDTIGCDVVPQYPFEEKGEPFYKEGLFFKGWDVEPHVHETPDTYYYTAVYGEEDIDLDKILCFTALDANSNISYGCMNLNCPEIEYSLDSGKTWKILKEFEKIEFQNEGDKVYVRGNNPNGLSKSKDEYTYFTMNYRFAASGSVMSLLDGKGESTVIPCDYCFTNLFNKCLLVQAPELPATELTKGCYSGMFSSCASLQKAPELPAETIKDESYSAMFSGCINLTETPELRATTLGEHCYMGMFVGCGNLTKAHDLPAMKLETGCYEYMFTSCQSLKTPPALPATELADSCYNYMFLTCTSLTKAPLLPATTLKKSCYDHMFTACINLEEVPDLGATVAAEKCCDGMFISCNNLKKAPALPATTLDVNCYHLMFAGCVNLTEAPELPATVMKDSCYFSMFASCINLDKAPVLPAKELAKGCYMEMFTECRKLNYIKVGITTLDNEINATENWVDGIDGPGTFIFPCGSKYDKHGVSEVPDNFKIISSPIAIFQNPDSTVLYSDTINCGDIPSYERCDTCKTPYYGDSLVFLKWDKELDILDDPDIYYYTAVYEKKGEKLNLDKILCFTAEEAGSKIGYTCSSKIDKYPDVQYSIDGGETWHKLERNKYITLENIGDKVYFRGNNPNGLSIGDPINLDVIFFFLMEGKIAASGSIMSLIDGVGETTVIPCNNCFESLFIGCDALTQAPELSATVLTEFCYSRMFEGCSSLTKAPDLPAKDLARYCYIMMFDECTSLTQAPELPASELAYGCYMGMLESCISLTQAPKLAATELAEDCYSYMFARCTSLIKAPELPASELTTGCYDGMFYGCTSLTQAPELPATKLAAGCYNGMFEGCSSLAKAPELPAKELVFSCYKNMFSECSKLDTIKVGVMSLDNDFVATENWVDGIDGPGVFIFPCGSKYDKHGVSEVPDNFIIIASPIVIFQNPDSTVLYRDTINCGDTPKYEGKTPEYKDGLVWDGWDKPLEALDDPDIYYYTAVYKEGEDLDLNKILCFTAEKAGSTISYQTGISEILPDVQYSFDGKTWSPLLSNENITLENVGDKVYFKGYNPNGFDQTMSYGGPRLQFVMNGSISASGSIMSLIDGIGETTVIPCDNCFEYLFGGCDALTQAPELPATELTTECYSLMFSGCSSLAKAPELPATKLAEYCYGSMFLGCHSLTKAPELPAIELTYGCYSRMFVECSSLAKAPELPATELAEYCYVLMFTNCISLINAPELHVTELTTGCYNGMFAGCSSLVKAPELPATKLTTGCYKRMFEGCSSLEKAPELPAKELVISCYEDMFSGCTNLNYIKVGIKTLDNDVNATRNWVEGIDGPGVFIFPCGSKYDKHGVSEVPDNFKIISSPIVIFQNPDEKELWRDTIGCDVVPEYPLEEKGEPFYKEGLVFKGWDVEPHVHETPDTYYYTAVYEEKTDTTVENNWLCFTAEEAGSNVWYKNHNNNPDIQYSIDEGKTWNTLEAMKKITLENVGDKVYFRGNNRDGLSFEVSPYSDVVKKYTNFEMTGQIAASGSVMSLIDETGETTTIPCKRCFAELFYGCDALTKAPKLPAKILTEGCYENMFAACTKLTEAPELPATKLSAACYKEMFSHCTSLEKAPLLPAKTLADECYYAMFSSCVHLTEAPELPATEMAQYCYAIMFNGTSIKTSPALPAKKLAEGCYTGMFTSCKLTNAPALPAEEMANYCYHGMFYDCTSLLTPPELPAEKLAEGCYSMMFANCTNLIVAPELPTKTLAFGCYANMFNDCSSLTKAPELPAENLIEECYNGMFTGCYNLNYIKVGVMSLDNEFYATENWVGGIDGPGVFVFPCGSTYDKHGNSEVPPLFEIISNKYTIGLSASACDSFVYNGVTYHESKEWNDTLSTSYGCDSIVSHKIIIHNSIETEMNIKKEDSFVWNDITYTDDATWVDSFQTVFGCDSVVRYNLTIIKKEKKDLNLTVDDEFVLILPGGTEKIGYELTGGIGSQYEVRYKGKLICSGDVSNDSTVDLTCSKNMEPGEYIATMEMCDDEGNCAKEDFTFNVMLPDNKQKSYYVKVWNDVVICRNGDGQFVSYQWYKDRNKCEDANLQYFNDKSLLGGEYMVHVTDKDGKSYFIEPIQYEAELAKYGITANPNIVEKSAEFTVSVTGVSDDDLTNARIVVYRADGIVEKILNNVEVNTAMRLGSGEYIIVLTVNDGKNANCKVLVK